MYEIYVYICIYIYVCMYRYIYIIYVYIYIYQLCLPLFENVKLQFFQQEDIFYLKPVIFRFVQKPS